MYAMETLRGAPFASVILVALTCRLCIRSADVGVSHGKGRDLCVIITEVKRKDK
jgi:hypothetical protein